VETMTTTEEAGRKRWKKLTPKESSELHAKAAAAFWAPLAPEERSALMKARAAKRKRRKRAILRSRKRLT
jgi:hypothetical protein